MKGILIVADSARCHPDGTFSLLRAGVDRIEMLAGQPTVHRGSVLARMRGDAEEEGKHSFSLFALAENGAKIAPDVEGEISIPKGGGSAVVSLDFSFEVTHTGSYTFVLSLDGKQLDSWRISVSPASAGMLLGGKK